MKVSYFNQVASDCYPDKWLSESFTNQEQINLCKSEKGEAIFGNLERMIQNHRQSDHIKLSDCRADASNDIAFENKCFENFIKNTYASNEVMKKQFAQDYSKYM